MIRLLPGIRLFVVGAFALSLLASASSGYQLTPPAQVKQSIEDVPEKDNPIYKDYYAWRDLLTKGDFARLDQIGADLLKKTEKYPSGVDPMWNFVSMTLTRDMKDDDFQKSAQLLDRWLKAKPKSVPARLMAAHLWIKYAWLARGELFARDTPDEQMKLFSDRCRMAIKHLDEVKKLTKTPGALYYRLRIDAAFGSGKKPDVNWAYEALKADPRNIDVVQGMTYALLPRWFGEPGELEEFAAEAAKRTKEVCGEMHYAAAAIVVKRSLRDYVLAYHQFDWPRVKQGLRDWAKEFPEWNEQLDEEAQFAWLAGDVTAAVEAVQQLGELPRRAAPWQVINQSYDDFRQRVNPDSLAGSQRTVIPHGMREITQITIVNDELLVSAEQRDGVRVLDVANGERSGTELFDMNASTVSIHPTAGLLYAGVVLKPDLTIYDLSKRTSRTVTPTKSFVASTALSSNGELLAVGNVQGEIVMLDAKTGEQRFEFPVEKPLPVEHLAFDRTDRLLAAGYPEGDVLVFNVTEKNLNTPFKVSKRSVDSLTWSDALIAIGYSDGELHVINWNTKQRVGLWKTRGSIDALDFSPNSEILAIGVSNSTGQPLEPSLLIWKVGKEESPVPLKGHKLSVRAVCFANQGKTLISASDDWTFRFWEMP